jgi:hypothetical protein
MALTILGLAVLAQAQAFAPGVMALTPTNVSHYVEVREPTMVQVSGMGPSGRKFVGADAAK